RDAQVRLMFIRSRSAAPLTSTSISAVQPQLATASMLARLRMSLRKESEKRISPSRSKAVDAFRFAFVMRRHIAAAPQFWVRSPLLHHRAHSFLWRNWPKFAALKDQQ